VLLQLLSTDGSTSMRSVRRRKNKDLSWTCFYGIPSCNSELLHVLWNLLSCECAWSWVIRLLFARG
jgi:hypothetical protein